MKNEKMPAVVYRILFLIGVALFLIGQIILSKGNDYVYAQEPIDFAHWFLLFEQDRFDNG